MHKPLATSQRGPPGLPLQSLSPKQATHWKSPKRQMPLGASHWVLLLQIVQRFVPRLQRDAASPMHCTSFTQSTQVFVSGSQCSKRPALPHSASLLHSTHWFTAMSQTSSAAAQNILSVHSTHWFVVMLHCNVAPEQFVLSSAMH